MKKGTEGRREGRCKWVVLKKKLLKNSWSFGAGAALNHKAEAKSTF
jgi:hypothetical protein